MKIWFDFLSNFGYSGDFSLELLWCQSLGKLGLDQSLFGNALTSDQGVEPNPNLNREQVKTAFFQWTRTEPEPFKFEIIEPEPNPNL